MDTLRDAVNKFCDEQDGTPVEAGQWYDKIVPSPKSLRYSLRA